MTMKRISLAVLMLSLLSVMFINPVYARPHTPQQVTNCIEAGRDNGDSDKEIAGRCLPDPHLDSLEDYE